MPTIRRIAATSLESVVCDVLVEMGTEKYAASPSPATTIGSGPSTPGRRLAAISRREEAIAVRSVPVNPPERAKTTTAGVLEALTWLWRYESTAVDGAPVGRKLVGELSSSGASFPARGPTRATVTTPITSTTHFDRWPVTTVTRAPASPFGPKRR